MAARTWHLVSYDVREEKRLRLTAHLLEGYGERIQYSVFRCRMTRTELKRLEWELASVMDPEDRLLIIPLCDGCAAKVTETSGRRWDEPPPTHRVI